MSAPDRVIPKLTAFCMWKWQGRCTNGACGVTFPDTPANRVKLRPVIKLLQQCCSHRGTLVPKFETIEKQR